MSYSYGNCHVCGATIEERLVDHTLCDAGEWVLIRNVPTGVCTRCGEQILRWDVIKRLEEIIGQRNSKVPDSRLNVPVFAY